MVRRTVAPPAALSFTEIPQQRALELPFAWTYLSYPTSRLAVASGTDSEPLPKIELAMYLAEADASSERLS